MFNIMFPGKINQRYYEIHYRYVLNIFKYLGCDITEYEADDFIVKINDKSFLFDFWDTSEVRESDLPTFKFHCEEETDKVFAFPPVSFYDWDEYYKLEKEIKYSSTTNLLYSCRQRPYAGALERRTKVQKMLLDQFGEKHIEMNFCEMPVDAGILTKQIAQIDYWKEVHNIGLAVFVPGHHNNMLDRGHIQYMALGCCTVSPRLPERLPFNRTIDPELHYIQCPDDYSGLIELLNKHRYSGGYYEPWNSIGNNAKQLFKETCTPEAIGKWIKTKL